MVDLGAKGQLFRGVKRLLGDDETERLMVFEQPFRLVALITPILLRLRAGIQKDDGLACYLGRPVNFEGKATNTNATALRRLREACGYAGLVVVDDVPDRSQRRFPIWMGRFVAADTF